MPYFEAFLEAFIFMAVVIGLMIIIWQVGQLAVKWRGIFTAVVWLFSTAIGGVQVADNKGDGSPSTRAQEAVLDSIRANQGRLRASQDTLRSLMLEHQKQSTATGDSILTQIARIDTCVDQHFDRTDRQLKEILRDQKAK